MRLFTRKCRLYSHVALLLAVAMAFPLNVQQTISSAVAGSCANTYPGGGPEITGCAACSGGSCGGNWKNIGQYNICTFAAETGKQYCVMGTPYQVVGTHGECTANPSYIGVMVCLTAGGFAGCGAAVAYNWAACVAGGPGFWACIGTVCGFGAAGGAASAFLACCVPTCYCIDSCDPGPAMNYLVLSPILSGNNCFPTGG
jgi:hypothetical protein